MSAFEDLIVWQKARGLTRSIYEETRQVTWARDYGLVGQIQRAAVSIMSNIAEGNERGSWADFHRFLCIAKGSCAEVRSHLYVALDAGYLDQAAFHQLMLQTEEVSRLVGGLRVTAERHRDEPKRT